MAIGVHVSPAGIFFDLIVADAEVKWTVSTRAEIERPRWKSSNESLRLASTGKPRCPDLNRHGARIARIVIASLSVSMFVVRMQRRKTRAAATPRILQQIAEPPRAAPVCQPKAQKPDFVAAPA